MRYFFLWAFHLLIIGAFHPEGERNVVKIIKNRSLLVPRDAGRLSRGTTPERQRKEDSRSKSAPPKARQKQPASAEAYIQGLGRVVTVAQRRGSPAILTPSDIQNGKKASKKVASSTVSVTGMTFDPNGYLRTKVSGSKRVKSVMSTRQGGSGHMRVQIPGQKDINIRLGGKSEAELDLDNHHPHLGPAEIESRIWGKGTSVSSAYDFRKRELESRERWEVVQ